MQLQRGDNQEGQADVLLQRGQQEEDVALRPAQDQQAGVRRVRMQLQRGDYQGGQADVLLPGEEEEDGDVGLRSTQEE